MSPSALQAAVTTILNSADGPELSADELVHAVVEMFANRGVWGVPARGVRRKTGISLQTIPVSDHVAQAVAQTVRPPSLAVRDDRGTAHIPDLASLKPLSADFREALQAITEGKRNVVARHPVFAGAKDRVVMRPRSTERGDRYCFLPESVEAVVARVLYMIESNETYRTDLRQCQLSAVLRECGKPDDERGCAQFYFISLRRQQGRTVTGNKRSSKPGGRDPSVYCCSEHTLAARRIRETWRKREERMNERDAKKVRVASKHKR